MAKTIYTFRPLPVWPHPSTNEWDRRGGLTFRATFANTLALLDDELWRLDAAGVIIAAGFTEADIRQDGMIRANARQPLHPGVELSFDSKGKRFVYATDVCKLWQHNVRSIALGLEALRAVDRFGITRRGEQYAGFMRLAAGESKVERGRRLVEAAGGVRQALMAHHPDHNGDPADFAAVQAYREATER